MVPITEVIIALRWERGSPCKQNLELEGIFVDRYLWFYLGFQSEYSPNYNVYLSVDLTQFWVTGNWHYKSMRIPKTVTKQFKSVSLLWRRSTPVPSSLFCIPSKFDWAIFSCMKSWSIPERKYWFLSFASERIFFKLLVSEGSLNTTGDMEVVDPKVVVRLKFGGVWHSFRGLKSS